MGGGLRTFSLPVMVTGDLRLNKLRYARSLKYYESESTLVAILTPRELNVSLTP